MDDSIKLGQQELQQSADVIEKPIAIKVSRPALLDTKQEVLRSNPSLFVTCVSTLLTALLLSLCFLIIGIPPLYIETSRGRRIYVSVMVPLLTVVGTVLSYYSMQHPQLAFNSALAQVVKEIEQHATYLSTAVGNVEMELEARGLSLNSASTGESASTRSLPWTHKNQGLECFPSAVAPGGATSTLPTTVPIVGGAGILKGIDRLEEERDLIIATVHVGKEWRWLMSLLGTLNLRCLAGTTNPVMHHQRIFVHAMAISLARVEKAILSLYFSSFVLRTVNATAPINLRGRAASTAVAGSGPGFGNSAGVNGGSWRTRTEGSMFQPLVPVIATRKLHSSNTPGNEPGDSLTGSAFLIPQETPNESKNPAEAGDGGEEMTSQLTSFNVKGSTFLKVKLPEFPTLLSGGTAGRGSKKTQAHAQEGPPAATAAPAASTPVERALDMQPDAQWTSEKRTNTNTKRPHHSSLSEHRMSSCADTNKDNDAGGHGRVDVEDVSLATGSWRCGSAISTTSCAHSVIQCAPSRSIAAAGTASVDGNKEEARVIFSPRSGISTAQPQSELEPARGKGNSDSMAGNHTAASPPEGTGTRALLMSPSPLKPHLACPTRLQQPGTAAVASPSLTLHRGARFIGDENSVFATVLIHVQKGNSISYSRLYGALARSSYDASAGRHYFTNGADSSLTPSCAFSPLTVFYVPGHTSQREGLTILEKKLLQFVYCCPEKRAETNSVGSPFPADLSSLAFRGAGGGNGDNTAAPVVAIQADTCTSNVARETPSSLGSTPHRTPISAEQHVDSFIVAMQLLEDRPMRLAFLPVVIEPEPPRGTSVTYSDRNLQSLTAMCRTDLASCSKELYPGSGSGTSGTPTASAETIPSRGRHKRGSNEDGTTSSASEAPLPAPSPTTVPVLECVIDGVLCVLTEIEITVDASFQRPSKVLLIGVSLEDVSEEPSERGEIDLDVNEEVRHDFLEGSTGSGSFEGASGTKLLAERGSSPQRRETHKAEMSLQSTRSFLATPEKHTIQRHVASRSRRSLTRHEKGEGCTLGQEFRELICLE
ncbi:hypothetical protein MNV84_03665 [Leishmania braziliensis]|nr:hypothetical protein MNV84_03665 [Leishmania braziliensis]